MGLVVVMCLVKKRRRKEEEEETTTFFAIYTRQITNKNINADSAY